MKTKTQTTIFIGILLAMLILPAVTALTIKNVYSTPNEVAPGKTVKITLTIENEVGEDLENIVVGLDLSEVSEFAPYKSSTEKTIEEIDDEDTEDVKFELVALSNAKAGVYKIPVLISYILDENKTPIEKTSYISLTINAKPELQLDYEGELIKGKRNEINIKITNTGLTEVKFLGIEVKDVNGIRILSSKKVYLGDIESDDFDGATFDIFIESEAKNLINFPVQLNYRDATNKLYTEFVEIRLKTYTKKEAIELGLIKKSNAGLYAGIIIAIVIIWFVYRKIKKRKKNKKIKSN